MSGGRGQADDAERTDRTYIIIVVRLFRHVLLGPLAPFLLRARDDGVVVGLHGLPAVVVGVKGRVWVVGGRKFAVRRSIHDLRRKSKIGLNREVAARRLAWPCPWAWTRGWLGSTGRTCQQAKRKRQPTLSLSLFIFHLASALALPTMGRGAVARVSFSAETYDPRSPLPHVCFCLSSPFLPTHAQYVLCRLVLASLPSAHLLILPAPTPILCPLLHPPY